MPTYYVDCNFKNNISPINLKLLCYEFFANLTADVSFINVSLTHYIEGPLGPETEPPPPLVGLWATGPDWAHNEIYRLMLVRTTVINCSNDDFYSTIYIFILIVF